MERDKRLIRDGVQKMNAWIPVKKSFPATGKMVDVQFPSGEVQLAFIVENEYGETVWQTQSKQVAHLQDYTKTEREKFQILTEPQRDRKSVV